MGRATKAGVGQVIMLNHVGDIPPGTVRSICREDKGMRNYIAIAEPLGWSYVVDQLLRCRG